MEVKDLNPWVRYMDARTCRFSYDTPVVAYDCRLFFVREGNLLARMGERSLRGGKGACLYIPSGVPYQLFFEAPCALYVINFDLDSDRAEVPSMTPEPPGRFDRERLIPAPDCPPLGQPMLVPEVESGEGLLARALHEWEQNAPCHRELCSTLVKEALLCALRGQAGAPADPPPLVRQMARYIADHLSQPITGKALSAEFHYHAYYLGRQFRRAMGVSIHQYLLGERMKQCAALLVETGLSVRQIAAQTGFSSASHLCAYFRRAYAQTPAAYRATHRAV